LAAKMPIYKWVTRPVTAISIGPKTQFLINLSRKCGAEIMDLWPTEKERQQWLDPTDEMKETFRAQLKDLKLARVEDRSLFIHGLPITEPQIKIFHEVFKIDFVIDFNVANDFWMAPRDWPYLESANWAYRDLRDALEARLDRLEMRYDEIFDPIIQHYRENEMLLEFTEGDVNKEREFDIESMYRSGGRGVMGAQDVVVEAIENFLDQELTERVILKPFHMDEDTSYLIQDHYEKMENIDDEVRARLFGPLKKKVKRLEEGAGEKQEAL